MPPGTLKTVIFPGDGGELLRMLGIDAALDGMAAQLDLRRQNRIQPLAGRDAQLGLHQVHAGDELGNRVLHLDARVHFDKVELAVVVHEELDCARVLIADIGEAAAQSAAQLFAHLGRYLQRRSLFNQLLMAALDGTLALKERRDVAVFVSQNLELDVARLLDE